MIRKKVAFIEPAGSKSNVFENYMRLPLMGTIYLGTILQEAGYEVRIYNENVMEGALDPFEIEADVYCISCLTVSANRARLLAHEIRRINPKARVVVGGIHPSLVPEDFVEAADQVVYGEAEGNIIDIIEGNIPGKTIQGKPIENLDDLPLADYRLLENWSRINSVPVMTSRGCPFDCNFCTVTQVFGKKFRMQTPERIIRELRHVRDVFGKRAVFFYDDNFTANRKRIRDLCSLLDNEDFPLKWSAQVRSDLARDPDLVDHMVRNGCKRFYIGFESINDETLKAMHKSQTRKDIEHSITTFRERGISIHAMFIFGEDNDSPDSIDATVRFALKQNIDTLQFMILTPFPGTRLYGDLERQNRIIHKQWDYYNGMYTVFHPRHLSPTRLQQETLRAYERFYSLRRVSLDGLRIVLDMLVDAFTLNFSRVYTYTFESVFLQTGARFIVTRYAKTFEPYIEFLRRMEERRVLNAEDGE